MSKSVPVIDLAADEALRIQVATCASELEAAPKTKVPMTPTTRIRWRRMRFMTASSSIVDFKW